MSVKTLHIVHCIDTEGPLTEDLRDSFKRLKSLFGIELEANKNNLEAIQLGNIDHPQASEIKKVFSKELLNYNNSWQEIELMLDECMSRDFRNYLVDDFGNGWVYSWHCMDHVGYKDNPRRKDLGFGNVFRFYEDKIASTGSHLDEINWHFHPLHVGRNPLKAATSYYNSMDVLLEAICRRIIDNNWFPTTNRPGFHSERPDSHLFLEQWLPFDYANQRYDYDDGQADLINGRFGDWRRAPKTWTGYNPSHLDYQVAGNCNRVIFRCLNIGTRFNLLKKSHVIEAFEEANNNGDAILSFSNHDYRDMRGDIRYVQNLIKECQSLYPDVNIKFSGANEAARIIVNGERKLDELKLSSNIKENKLIVKVVNGSIFGPQPFLAIKTKSNDYYHDNLDVIEFGKVYSYTFDEQTILKEAIDTIGIGSAGKCGSYDVNIIKDIL